MARIGKLKDGRLSIEEEIESRNPILSTGLEHYYPFDGTPMRRAQSKNILDTSIWVEGTSGSVGMFSANGAASENERVKRSSPWGYDDIVWATLKNDEASGADGGWNSYNHTVDPSKRYRLTVWVKREDVGNGRTYLGCQDGGSVCSLSTGEIVSNPYFTSFVVADVPSVENNWLLMVYYVHPSSYTGTTDITSGIYGLDGTKITRGSDFKWNASTARGGHRAYLYYSTSVNEKQYFYKPRFEVCDGNEPSIWDLLNGNETIARGKIRYIRDWSNGSTANTGNHWVEIQANDYFGRNIALESTNRSSPILTDGVTEIANSNNYYGPGAGLRSVQVDLGDAYHIDEVKIWRYYVDGRSYKDTKTEVSEDGVSWRPIFDSSLEGIYPETPSGRAFKVNHMGGEITHDGLTIQDDSTNIFATNQNFKGWGAYNGAVATVQDGISVPEWNTDNATWITTTGGTHTLKYYKGVEAGAQGQSYTASVKIKNIGSNAVRFRTQLGNTVTVQPGETSHAVCTGAGNGTTSFQFRFEATNIDHSLSFLAYQPMGEKKPIATNFTPSYRAKGLPFVAPNIGGYTNYTLTGTFIPYSPFKNGNATITTDQADLFRIEDVVNTGGIYYRYYPNSTSSASSPFIDPDGVYGTAHIHSNYELSERVPIFFVVRKSGTTFITKIYQNNTLKGTHSLTVPANCRFDRLVLGGTIRWNGTYSDLAIYSRALTDDEIDKVRGSAMNLSKNGSLYIKDVKESPLIPTPPLLHFPLYENPESLHNLVKPVIATNLAYDKGNLSLNGARTNIAGSGHASGVYNMAEPWGSSITAKGSYVSIPNPIDSSTVSKTTYLLTGPATGGIRFGITSGLTSLMLPITASTVYTWSYFIKVAYRDYFHKNFLYVREYNSAGTQVVETGKADMDNREYYGDGWYRIWCTWTTSSTATQVRLDHYGYEFNDNEIYCCGGQLEKSAFLTPYLSSSSAIAKLSYRNTDIISNDWQTFSVAYWIKNMSADNKHNLIGTYPKWYFGIADTKVPIFSWTESGSQKVMRGNVATKDKEWNFLACTVSSTELKMYCNGTLMIGAVVPALNATTPTNLQLNGIADNNQTNPIQGYLRDLMIWDKGLTKEELDAIYKVQARAYNNGTFTIQDQMIEGGIR